MIIKGNKPKQIQIKSIYLIDLGRFYPNCEQRQLFYFILF